MPPVYPSQVTKDVAILGRSLVGLSSGGDSPDARWTVKSLEDREEGPVWVSARPFQLQTMEPHSSGDLV